jgi:uncharacterized protein
VEDNKAFRINGALYEELDRLTNSKRIDFKNLDPELAHVLMESNLINTKKHNQTLYHSKNENFPIASITLNIVQECNMKCIYCYGGNGEYGNKGYMSEKVAKHSVDWLLENSFETKDLSIVFFGGEPLLNFPLIKKVVAYALVRTQSEGKRIHFSITTNGSLLNSWINHFLNEYNFNVTISFDGTEALQNKNRPLSNGKNSYSTIRPRVEKFLKSRNGRATGRTTLTTGFGRIEDIRKKLASLGFRKIEYIPVSFRNDAEFKLNPKDHESLLKDLENQADTMIDSLKDRNPLLETKLVNMVKALMVGNTHNYFCGAGRSLVGISSSGEIYPCHRFVGDSRLRFGSIKDHDLVGREQFIRGIQKKSHECRICWARNLCGGGCYHDNLISMGSLSRPLKVKCMEIKRSIELAIYIHDYLDESDLQHLKKQGMRSTPI